MSEENKFILDVEIAPLKAQLKDAAAELQGARQKFGEFSDEAITAAKKVAAIKDEIEGAAEQAKLFDPGSKFLALGTLASQAAGGIAAVQGALALIGTESEDVNKALMKVQGALALSQGLSELKDFGKSFDFIKTSIKGAVQGLNGFQKALVASGIGAAVVAIGLLIAYWDDLKDAIMGTSDSTRAYKEAQEDVNRAVADATAKFSEVNVAINLAKEGVISKETALKTYNEKLGSALGKVNSFQEAEKRVAEFTSKYIKSIELRTRAQVLFAKAAETSAKIASGEDVDPGFWQTIGNSILAGGNAFAFASYQAESYANNVADLQDKVTTYTDIAKKDLEEALKLEKEINAGGVTAQTEKEDKAISDKAAKKKAATEKADQAYKDAVLKAQQILFDARMSQLSEQQQEEEKIIKKFNEDKAVLELAKATPEQIKLLEDQKTKALTEVADKYRKEEEERVREYETKLNEIRNQTRFANMEEGIEKEREMIRVNYAAQIDEVLKNEKLKDQEKQNLIAALEEQRAAEIAMKEEEKAVADYEKAIVEQERVLAANEGRLDIEKQVLDEKQRLTEEAYQNGLLTEEQYNDKLFEYTQQRKTIAETELENRRAINAALLGLAGQFGQTLQAIAGKNKKVAIAGVVIEQAAAIGQIIANTAIANAKAVKTSPTTFGLPWVAINTISGALSIASTIANAKKSIQQIQQSDSATTPTNPSPTPSPGGGGGATAPSVPAPVATIGNSPVEALGQVVNPRPQPVRAYVVESEVSANQQRVSDIARRADLFP